MRTRVCLCVCESLQFTALRHLIGAPKRKHPNIYVHYPSGLVAFAHEFVHTMEITQIIDIIGTFIGRADRESVKRFLEFA